jgi:hypothetical protein
MGWGRADGGAAEAATSQGAPDQRNSASAEKATAHKLDQFEAATAASEPIAVGGGGLLTRAPATDLCHPGEARAIFFPA